MKLFKLRFNIFYVEGMFLFVGPSLHRIIRALLIDKGRCFVTNNIIFNKFKFKNIAGATILMDKIIKDTKYPDLDYTKLLQKHGRQFVNSVLSGKGWSEPEIENYIINLPDIKE